MHRITLGLLILACSFCACHDNATEPSSASVPPGKRNYIWSIDSVDYGNLPGTIQLESIWGSSPTDIWGAGDAPDVRDCLWHYNGVKWSRATAGTPITEFTGNKTVQALWGSARNDVWTAGRKVQGGVLSSFLMHYDGVRWIDATPPNVSALGSILYCIFGLGENNIWVGGYEYALHFNGSSWKAFKVADSMIINGITGRDSTIIFHLASPWGKQDVFLYQFQSHDTTFAIVDHTSIHEAKFGGWPWILGNKLYSITAGILSTDITDSGRIDTLGWRREFTTNTYFTQRFVESTRDVFAVGQWNLIYHYNGTDWKQLFISAPNHTVDPYALFWGVWTDGKEVFICDWQNGIVYHGR